MKLLAAVVGLVLVLSAEATFGGRFLSLDDHEKLVDTSDLQTKDRFKKNDKAEDLQKESDDFGFKKGSEARDSVKSSESHESILEFSDFDDKAKKNDLSKDKNFELRLKDESDEDSSNEFHSSRGTDLKSKERSSFDHGSDKSAFHNENLDVGSESERLNRFSKELDSENLFGDRSESLLDTSLDLEFGIGHGLHRITPIGHGGHRLNHDNVGHVDTPDHVDVDNIGLLNGVGKNIGHKADVLGVGGKVGHKADVLGAGSSVGHNTDVLDVGRDIGHSGAVLDRVDIDNVADLSNIPDVINDAIPPQVAVQVNDRSPSIKLRGRLAHILSRTSRIG